MQRLRTIITVYALSSVLCAAASFAQQREPLPGQSPGAPTGRSSTPELVTPKATKSEVSPVPKASSIIGSTVVNRQEESLGTIEDLVIDVATGGIRYVAVSHGSFLGMGGKLLAVPWKALELRPDGTTFVLNLSREALEKAPGFDKTNWPQQPDPTLSAVAPKPDGRSSTLPTTVPGIGVAATVQTVNVPAERLTVKMEKGDSVELQAPKTMLTGLQAGDRVEVKIVGTQVTELHKK